MDARTATSRVVFRQDGWFDGGKGTPEGGQRQALLGKLRGLNEQGLDRAALTAGITQIEGQAPFEGRLYLRGTGDVYVRSALEPNGAAWLGTIERADSTGQDAGVSGRLAGWGH